MKLSKEQLLSKINEVCKGNLMETLSIEFIEASEDIVVAKMPVNESVHQPDGVLHGGATVALAETVGSFASILRIDTNTHYVRGINISANHVKSVSDGFVYAAAKSVHSGRTTQTFDIEVTNEKSELISTCRLTTITLPK